MGSTIGKVYLQESIEIECSADPNNISLRSLWKAAMLYTESGCQVT